ncbi:hypothetical protein FHR24_000509 [Wenyingzhuangia heitensis]|uniref:DUF6973 domain-containing protein n=1 Tax=Wenyingzhuangia heitensis TaxID=1487859 RepID=A0ABX0U5C8_9FLAO|nr:hypothetical protein [Wenyingzhuangia heitensis]NIJ44070.1 hypothetical protein [Wenyingzhuangia heitensis]
MKVKIFRSVLLLALLFTTVASSQSSKKAFKKLSSAEKCWVIFHPFKAKRAYRVTKEVKQVVDSILHTQNMGNHHAGNQLDAFKHAFWMWSLAEEIGWRSAKSLGDQHEKGNYQFFKEHKLEDRTTPDKVSGDMDLHNNSIGIKLYKLYKKQHLSQKERIEKVKEAVLRGEMRMIYQTHSGKYLNANGYLIPKKEYYGVWDNAKCLVPSTSIFLMADNKSKSLNLPQNIKQ